VALEENEKARDDNRSLKLFFVVVYFNCRENHSRTGNCCCSGGELTVGIRTRRMKKFYVFELEVLIEFYVFEL
jgi:hypothetical protein